MVDSVMVGMVVVVVMLGGCVSRFGRAGVISFRDGTGWSKAKADALA